MEEDDVDVGEARSGTFGQITLMKASSAYSYYDNLRVSPITNTYAMYSSPYSGAFSLLDTVVIPRPCAYESKNLTQMDYFYGQWYESYDVKAQTGADKVIS